MRANSKGNATMASFSGYSYSDNRKCLLSKHGEEIKLRPKSLAVFKLLSEQPDTVVSRQVIVDAVWKNTVVTDDSLGKCISDIRRALKDTDHKVLQTIPKQGYMLVADPVIPDQSAQIVSSNTGHANTSNPDTQLPQFANWRKQLISRGTGIVALALVVTGIFWVVSRDKISDNAQDISTASLENNEPMSVRTADSNNRFTLINATDSDQYEFPTLSLEVLDTQASDDSQNLIILSTELRNALSHYRTIKLTDKNDTAYRIKVLSHTTNAADPQINIELIYSATQEVIFAERLNDLTNDNLSLVAARVAGLLASPSGGAIGRHLMVLSRDKPADKLTRAECIAHGYDCTNCSGELDSITSKAAECLARLLQENPQDAQAWALQSTLYAHQYTFGSTLSEPQRTDLSQRAFLKEKAVNAASRAEEFSDGGDSAVYWGMAQAYNVSCEKDKLRAAAQRGIEINPHDPGLLAAFGNWIAYTGHWDEGAALIEQALQHTPRIYKKWWLFGLAKRHYAKQEYQQAYELFIRAYNERNWLSPLQLAYTLPHLNRLNEAKHSINKLLQIAPGITLERVLELYKSYCFPDEYLAAMKRALLKAGIPSRGSSENFNTIKPPHAKIISLGDYKVEYMDLGQGIPVVFVHGAISDYRTWAHYQNPISEKYRYISYSRRYFGSQPFPDQGTQNNNDHAATDLIDFIEELQLEPVVLVTWSSGGPIANLAAAARPELFRGLIHYEPVDFDIFTQEESDQFSQSRDLLFNSFDQVDVLIEQGQYENAAKHILETVFDLEPGDFEKEIMPLRRIVLDSVRELHLPIQPSTPNSCELLNTILIPTEVVRGANTNRYWFEMSAKFAECMPNANLTTLPGVNHDGPIRDYQAFYKVIEHFIRTRL